MSTHTSSIVLDGDTCEFRTTLRANGDQQHVMVQINAVRGNVFAQNLTHLHLDLDAAVRLYQELGFALAWASYRDNIRAGDLGEPLRHIESEPLEEPAEVPAEPAKAPEKVPA